jgi:Zn-dependent peptidase ImmA (M78 family)
MQRGFKTRAEKVSCQLRAEMGLSAHAPLPGKQLIAHLKVLLIQPADIPGIQVELLHEVLNGSSDHWSAITFYDQTGRPVIIFNPRHAPTRQESDLMHEAAHILCKHPPAKIVRIGGFAMRTYDESQEEEAKWLGACLQITRDGLLWAIREQMTTAAMASFYGASEALVRFRRNTSGVDVQIKRYQAYRRL